MDIKTALVQGTNLLEEAAVAAPRLTAEVLLSHALKQDRVYLFAHATDPLPEVGWIHYGRYLHERLAGKPTQYITKKQEFYGREFRVTSDVLIPRPETEHVVSAALERLSPDATVVDVGCGSGAIAISIALEAKSARVFATDISLPAVKVARGNAYALDAVVSFACTDLTGSLRPASIDVLVSNPPYVGLDEADGLQREVLAHEPHVALFAGPKGTDLYERIVSDAARVIRPGGWLIFELGWKSYQAVRDMLSPAWTNVQDVADLAGIPRVLCAQYMP